MFYNYANNSKTFLDGASSALMAASVYRAAVLFGNTDHLAAAENVYTTIGGADPSPSSSSSSSPSASSITSSASSSVTPEPGRKRHAAAARRPQHHRVALSPLHHTPRATSSKHITSTGWLTPVVDPHSFHQAGTESAEGQAFVLMMYAARNDWIASGGVVGNSTLKSKANGAAANVVGVGVVAGSPASVADGSSGGLNGVGNVGPSVSNSTSSSNSTTSASGAQRMSVTSGLIAFGALVAGTSVLVI